MTDSLQTVASSLPFNTVIDIAVRSEVVFLAELQSSEDAGKWLQAYESLTHSHWNVRKTYPSVKKMLFRKDFVCHHSAFMKADIDVANSTTVNKRGCSKKLQLFCEVNHEGVL